MFYQVGYNADANELKKAYRVQQVKWHPGTVFRYDIGSR